MSLERLWKALKNRDAAEVSAVLSSENDLDLNLNYKAFPVLHEAISAQNLDFIRLLLSYCPQTKQPLSVDSIFDGRTALMRATSCPNAQARGKIVECLLANKASVTLDSGGFTALHAAARIGDADLVRKYLGLRADPNAIWQEDENDEEDKNCKITPAHLAAMTVHFSVITVLAEFGANLEMPMVDARGANPLTARDICVSQRKEAEYNQAVAEGNKSRGDVRGKYAILARGPNTQSTWGASVAAAQSSVHTTTDL